MQLNRQPSCHQASLLHLVHNQVFHQLGTCLFIFIQALHRHPMLRWVSARWGTLLLMDCHNQSLLPICNHNHNHLLMDLKVIEMELLEVTVQPLPRKNQFTLRSEGLWSLYLSLIGQPLH